MTLKSISLFSVITAVIIIVVYWGKQLQDLPPKKYLDTDRIYRLLEDLTEASNATSYMSNRIRNIFGNKVASTKVSESASSLLSKTENTNSKQLLEKIPKVGVICYVPSGDHQALHFLTMLYGSWKYSVDNVDQYFDKSNSINFHHIDLLAFCHPSVCPSIHSQCKKFNKRDNIKDIKMNCWAIEQQFESPVPYGPINSFVMFNRTDISEILEPYNKIIRTDFDVFITPALLTWQPAQRVVFGQGGYCDPFNMKRLKEISSKLHMRHQGVHCIGSTWFGERDFFIKLSKKTYEMTAYMYLNEFDPSAPGLETIDFKKNREGEWVRWWRPVSLLYGAELAINHLVDNLNKNHKGEFDTPSCSKKHFLETPHIHCWHSDCEFQKFKFMNQLTLAIQSKESLSGDIVHRILQNAYTKDVKNMSISQYSTFIAWNSVGKYLRKWFI